MAPRIKVPRRPRTEINLPSQPRYSESTEEVLTGMVDDMEASAPEERLAMTLRKRNIPFRFRYVIGAPKGLPGWKELDFLIQKSGLLYALEVDTAFTHRNKEQKDKLHDAMIMNDRNIQELGTLYPEVFHADGDSDLASLPNTEMYVTQRFGR